jgi:uncharacterized protein YkwD
MSLFSWLASLFLRTPPPAPVPPPVPATGIPAQMLALHNAARARAGLPPLALDARLTSAAQQHAAGCARWGRLDHAGWDAEIRAAGYPTAAIGQNLSEGEPDAAGAFADLFADPPHRAAILGRQYARLGVGVADGGGVRYYCCNYGG